SYNDDCEPLAFPARSCSFVGLLVRSSASAEHDAGDKSSPACNSTVSDTSIADAAIRHAFRSEASAAGSEHPATAATDNSQFNDVGAHGGDRDGSSPKLRDGPPK